MAAVNGNGGACGLNGPYFRNMVAVWNEDGFLVGGEGDYQFITDAPADGFLYVRDGLTRSWVRAFTQLDADLLYIGEAPTDGREYARRGSDRSWQPVETTPGISDSPHDIHTYGRHMGTASSAWDDRSRCRALFDQAPLSQPEQQHERWDDNRHGDAEHDQQSGE